MKLVKAKDGYIKVGDKYLLAKKCSKCGKWLVASADNYYRQKRGKYGLVSQCKECKKQYCGASPEYYKQYYKANKDKRTEYNKQYREANKDKIAKQRKQYYQDNREKITEKHKQWNRDNKDKRAEYDKQYYQDNKDKIAERSKRYREANREKVRETSRKWYLSPNGQVSHFNSYNKRKMREQNQGNGITGTQWREMMSFFDWKCAYSGKYIGGKQNYQRTIDHIVSLNSGGEHEIWNLVPMTRSLNSSKQEKDMLEWYKEQDCFSEARLAKIYEWQEYARRKWKNS